MKKLLLLALLAFGGIIKSSAAVNFIGHSAINVNGQWYFTDNETSGWCTGGAFNGHNFGIITTLSLGGQSQTWESGNINWNGGTVLMYYRIDDAEEHSIDLNYYSYENNNNKFQSGGSNFTMTPIDLSGLSSGEHTLRVWFLCGEKYDSNNGNDYIATFKIADTYTRDVTTGNFGTICLPFDATVEGATVFKIVSKVEENNALTAINLESVESLEAGHAYIFKATGSTLTATYSGTYADATEADGMLGNLSAADMTVPQGNYVVSGNQIHLVDGDAVTCGQYRAYITLSGISVAQARSANFIGFEEPTGIESVQTNNQTAAMFNLQGQRVTDAQKGLVIVNGKKMLRK